MGGCMAMAACCPCVALDTSNRNEKREMKESTRKLNRPITRSPQAMAGPLLVGLGQRPGTSRQKLFLEEKMR